MRMKRNYGIDLLRIVLMVMVCLLHIIGVGGILNSLPSNSLEYNIYYFIYILCFYAVNGFAIISGYMATNKPPKYNKIIEMWFQVVFYSFVVTAIFSALGLYSGFGWKEMIKCLMPVTFDKFWYFTAYFGLFFATPILNKFIFSIDEIAARRYFVILFVIFTIIGLPIDTFKTSWGYSTLWLIVLYCIGAFAKIGRIFEAKKTLTLVIGLLLCVSATWFLSTFLNIHILKEYTSPTMLLSGLLIVIIFSRLELNGRVVSKISPYVFGVYLFHLNQVIWGHICNGFTFIGEKNLVQGLLYVFLIACVIFISGLCVEFVRSQLAKAVKIPALSKKIVDWVAYILQKACYLLK